MLEVFAYGHAYVEEESWSEFLVDYASDSVGAEESGGHMSGTDSGRQQRVWRRPRGYLYPPPKV